MYKRSALLQLTEKAPYPASIDLLPRLILTYQKVGEQKSMMHQENEKICSRRLKPTCSYGAPKRKLRKATWQIMGRSDRLQLEKLIKIPVVREKEDDRPGGKSIRGHFKGTVLPFKSRRIFQLLVIIIAGALHSLSQHHLCFKGKDANPSLQRLYGDHI